MGLATAKKKKRTARKKKTKEVKTGTRTGTKKIKQTRVNLRCEPVICLAGSFLN